MLLQKHRSTARLALPCACTDTIQDPPHTIAPPPGVSPSGPLLIPSQGVIYQNGGVCAFVREEPGKEYPNRAQDVPKDTVPKGFVPVTIEIGIADDKNTQVLDGLSEGEEIYMTSQPQEEEEEEMGGMAFGVAAPFTWGR